MGDVGMVGREKRHGSAHETGHDESDIGVSNIVSGCDRREPYGLVRLGPVEPP